MTHPHLQKLLDEAQEAHNEMWAVATAEAKRTKRGLYNSYKEAAEAHPGYSRDYFWKDENGYWRCF